MHGEGVFRLLRSSVSVPPASLADEELVLRAQAGDTVAFGVLFERHVVAVRRFLCDVLRAADKADDATQEAFVRAHAQLTQTTATIRFKPWMMGIARNVAFEAMRVKRHGEFEEQDSGIPDAVIPSPNPEQVLLDAELNTQLNAAMGALSEERRAALLLRIDHGLSYDEIGAMFGWTLPTVKNEIHRARLKLRASLLPHLIGESS